MVKGWDRMNEAQRRDYTLSFVEYMGREIPGCRVAYKDDPPDTMPWWHRVAHRLGRVFVPEYDTRFTTVIHSIIYLPTGTRESFQRRPQRWYPTLRHEFIHLKDFQRFSIWMGVSYVLLCPAFWTMRAFWELRGYAQGMIFLMERDGAVPDRELDRLAEIFSGRAYFYMMWPRRRAVVALESLREAVEDGRLEGFYPYGPLRVAPPPSPVEGQGDLGDPR